MPPAFIFDISKVDLTVDPVCNKELICKTNPQSFEMQQLDGILWYDEPNANILGYKDVTDQEFWIRGHIPGRPLMPGVIMIESAAQLLSFYVNHFLGMDGFLGFGGIESAKFRATVVPGQRLYLLGHLFEMKKRRYRCHVQGAVEDKLAFEATVAGIRL